jgi:hypothetical protein
MKAMKYERRNRNQHGEANVLTRREINTLVGCFEKIAKIAQRDGMYVLVKSNLLVALTKITDAAEISDREFKRT